MPENIARRWTEVPRFGINLAGADFGQEVPGVYDCDYTYPPVSSLAYYAERGRTLVRLPFRWERMQRTLGGPLDTTELGRMREFLRGAAEHRMDVVIDVHNYGRYVLPGETLEEASIIGSERIPIAAFADFWGRLAKALRGEGGLYAYGLMNEPHDMEDDTRWPRAAQAAIEAIRKNDGQTPIIVPGDHWSASRHWRSNTNEQLAEAVSDPSNNLVFEAHCYFDRDNSGSYKFGYDEEGGSPDGGVEHVRSFAEWCEEKNVRGFIGEYGIPNGDARWLVTMDRFQSYLLQQGLSSAYWVGGPWWGDYPLSIEPAGPSHTEDNLLTVDRPQMLVLRQYPG